MNKPQKLNIKLKIPITIHKEGEYFIAFTPVLDLSTSGKSPGEVKMRFEEAVVIFFEELLEKGTLDKVLTELGWEKNNQHWAPPMIAQESINVNIPLSN